MALPAIQGSSLPTSVCGKNERVPIDQMTSPPFKWICSLSIVGADGAKHYGSGFKIHLPDVDRTAIVTSGSCICVKGKYATKITVQFPGQEPVEVKTNGFYTAPEYMISRRTVQTTTMARFSFRRVLTMPKTFRRVLTMPKTMASVGRLLYKMKI